jgi:hypothetical protein
MNWKFWTWPLTAAYAADMEDQLMLARRRSPRGEPAMEDAQVVEAFDGLVDHRGFEAVLQILTEEQLKSVEDMMTPTADLATMKQSAGRAEGLADFKLKLLELEDAARRRREKKK